jgi:uncharacterized protein (DUF736 family)
MDAAGPHETIAAEFFSPPLRHPARFRASDPDAPAPRARFAPKNTPTPVLRCASADTVRRSGGVHERSAIAGDRPRRPDQEDHTMPAIGYVTRQEDGSFKGQLRTLSIRADIEILPNRTKNTESQPDYRIVTNSIEVGAAWRRTSRDTGASYVSLSLAAPEFGPRKLYANLGRAAGQDDDNVFAVIWNPAD